MTDISSIKTSQAAKDLVLDLRDVIRNEEAWAIADKHLRIAKVAAVQRLRSYILFKLRSGTVETIQLEDIERLTDTVLDGIIHGW